MVSLCLARFHFPGSVSQDFPGFAGSSQLYCDNLLRRYSGTRHRVHTIPSGTKNGTDTHAREHLNKQLTIMTGQEKLVTQSQEMSDSGRFGPEWYWGTSGVREPVYKLGPHYACWQRNRYRRAINKLASAHATTKRWAFFANPR